MRVTTGWKIFFWITVLLLVWSLFVNPTIFDSILTFCLAGVVPGTDTVLSPNAVIAIVGGTLGFIVLLIVGIPILRRLIGRRQIGRERLPEGAHITVKSAPHQKLGGVVIASLEEGKLPTPATADIAEAPVVVTDLAPKQTQKSPLAVKAVAALVLLRGKVHIFTKQAIPMLYKFDRVARIIIRHESRNFKQFAKQTFAVLKKHTIIAAGWTATQMIAFWAWLKPRINRFDAWLAKQFRPYKKKLAKKARKYDTLMLLGDIAKGLLREVKPYNPVVLWGKFREEQQQTKRSLKDAE